MYSIFNVKIGNKIYKSHFKNKPYYNPLDFFITYKTTMFNGWLVDYPWMKIIQAKNLPHYRCWYLYRSQCQAAVPILLHMAWNLGKQHMTRSYQVLTDKQDLFFFVFLWNIQNSMQLTDIPLQKSGLPLKWYTVELCLTAKICLPMVFHTQSYL